VALICTICFATRFIIWIVFGILYINFPVLPQTNTVSDIDSVFYPTLFYTIPDIVPSLSILFVMIPTQTGDTPFAEIDEDLKKEFVDSLVRSSFLPHIDQDLEYTPLNRTEAPSGISSSLSLAAGWSSTSYTTFPQQPGQLPVHHHAQGHGDRTHSNSRSANGQLTSSDGSSNPRDPRHVSSLHSVPSRESELEVIQPWDNQVPRSSSLTKQPSFVIEDT